MHVFECAATKCSSKTRFVCRFLDTSDAKSTGNLRRHAKVCWSDEVVSAADETRDIEAARTALKGVKTSNASITAIFQKVSEKRKALYKDRQFTKNESRYAWLIFIWPVSEMTLAVPNSSAG